MLKYFICLLSMVLIVACNDDFNLPREQSKLVVEGWIEDGGFPVVMLTRSLPVSTEYQNMEDLNNYVLRWAKVTVSNGTDSVILTGKYDKGYFPPFIYTTSRMRGEVGKTYTLTIDYRDYYATATTTIPSTPDNCIFKIRPCEDSDTLFQVTASFKDNPMEKDYYQIFTRVGTKMKQYQASYLGTIDDAVLNGETEIPVYRELQLNLHNNTPYFLLDDTVSVKFAHIDEPSFRFWNSYTKMLILSSNMFLSTSSDIEGNVIGGYGYWCGYGAFTNHIVVRDSIYAAKK